VLSVDGTVNCNESVCNFMFNKPPDHLVTDIATVTDVCRIMGRCSYIMETGTQYLCLTEGNALV
jgi:uncharacterized membrane protein